MVFFAVLCCSAAVFRPCDHPTPPTPQRQTRLGGASENPHRFAARRSHPGAFGSSASVFLRGTSGHPDSPAGLRVGSLPAILGCHGRAAAPSARRSFLLVDVLTVRVYHSQSTPLPSGSSLRVVPLRSPPLRCGPRFGSHPAPFDGWFCAGGRWRVRPGIYGLV